MRIIGHGVDIVETERVARLLGQHEARFLGRVFTEAERAYCEKNRKRRLEHYAGRFAAKEAVFKVLGTGWSGGIGWTDAEVVKLASGQPTVVLHGRCAEVAGELGIESWWLSLSHISTHAVASAIGVGG
ncbi:MAG: holo-ACP synthase [Planctomycetota bacterium]